MLGMQLPAVLTLPSSRCIVVFCHLGNDCYGAHGTGRSVKVFMGKLQVCWNFSIIIVINIIE